MSIPYRAKARYATPNITPLKDWTITLWQLKALSVAMGSRLQASPRLHRGNVEQHSASHDASQLLNTQLVEAASSDNVIHLEAVVQHSDESIALRIMSTSYVRLSE